RKSVEKMAAKASLLVLKELFDEGLITRSEYDQERAKALDMFRQNLCHIPPSEEKSSVSMTSSSLVNASSSKQGSGTERERQVEQEGSDLQSSSFMQVNSEPKKCRVAQILP